MATSSSLANAGSYFGQGVRRRLPFSPNISHSSEARCGANGASRMTRSRWTSNHFRGRVRRAFFDGIKLVHQFHDCGDRSVKVPASLEVVTNALDGLVKLAL